MRSASCRTNIPSVPFSAPPRIRTRWPALRKGITFEGNFTRKKSLDVLNLFFGNRYSLPGGSHKINHAFGAQHPEPFLRPIYQPDKSVAGEQGKFHHFLPVAPLAHLGSKAAEM